MSWEGSALVGAREADVFKEHPDVNIRGESQVGLGTDFQGSTWRGWSFRKAFKERRCWSWLLKGE